MEKISLKAQIREQLGKEAVKKLRRQELIPGVVYKGKKSLSIKIPTKDLLQAIQTKAGENVIINLQVEDGSRSGLKDKGSAPKKSTRTVIIKEIQHHPVKGDILHVDFNEISLTEALSVKVPIAVKGEAEGLKEGGVLEHALWEIELECLPTEIPENIPVDSSHLKIGDSILVKDLKIPPGIKVLSDPEATVIALAAPRAEEEIEEAKPEGEISEPEVIMEKKPEEEAPEETAKEKEPEKQGKPKEQK